MYLVSIRERVALSRLLFATRVFALLSIISFFANYQVDAKYQLITRISSSAPKKSADAQHRP
ncbi:hypothetical protein PCAR4_350192 [Paraburkholderia caribensis]|nr:hypothetical protein PCAR4_350192 [Paraburkholderia caribensis]